MNEIEMNIKLNMEWAWKWNQHEYAMKWHGMKRKEQNGKEKKMNQNETKRNEINEGMNEWMNEWTNQRTNEWMFSILKFLDRLTVFSSPFNFWQPFWVFLQDFHFYKTSETKPQRLTQRFVVEIGNWTFGGDWRLNLRLVPPADFKKFPSWAERGHWEKRVQKDPWKNGIFAKMKPINISHSYRQIHSLMNCLMDPMGNGPQNCEWCFLESQFLCWTTCF